MIYGLFLAYHVSEIADTDADSIIYKHWYPREYRKVLTYNTPREQLDAYANTPCAASQMITGENQEDFNKKVEEMHNNFDSEEWLEENIDPYV